MEGLDLNHNFTDIRTWEEGSKALQEAVNSIVNHVFASDFALFYVALHILCEIWKTIHVRTDQESFHFHPLANHIK